MRETDVLSARVRAGDFSRRGPDGEIQMACRVARYLGIILMMYSCTAAAAFFMVDEGAVPLLDKELSYRDGAAPPANFDRIRAETSGWVSQKDKPFRGMGEPVHLWVKIDMPITTTSRRVLIRTGAWESADYFVVRDGMLVDRQKAGTLVPWAERTLHVTMTPAAWHAGFVAVELRAQARTQVFVRLANDNRIRPTTLLQFSLWDEGGVREGELRDRFLQGCFVGVMLLLTLYNLARFASDVHELSYLYFVILTAANTLTWAILYGLPLEFLWPDRPAWDLYSLWIALPLGMHAFIQFERHFLLTSTQFPRIDHVLKWTANAALILLPAFLLPLAAGYPASLSATLITVALASAIVLPLLVGVTILALVKRCSFMPFFAGAMACYCAGAMITFGAMLDFLPETEWTLSAGQLGTAALAILFSMAQEFRMPPKPARN
jgi:hypothetical protein